MSMISRIFIGLLIASFVLAPFTSIQAQSQRTENELIGQYDSATTVEALRQFYESLTEAEKETLSDSGTHSFIVEAGPAPASTSTSSETTDDTDAAALNESGDLSGTASCFDHYTFGSVRAKLFTPIEQTVSGTSLRINGEVTNTNPYPITDADVYVRIYRHQDQADMRTTNGDEIVAQFSLAQDIALAAGEQQEYAVSWEMPAHLRSGDYYAASYVAVSDRYNLLGLTFTDDVAGDKTFFSVDGAETGVYFNKNDVTLNGDPHQFVGPIPRMSETAPVTARAELTNTTDSPKEVNVSWSLSSWDGLNPRNQLATTTQSYTVPAGGTTTAEYTVQDADHSVYFLAGSLSYEDSGSLINIRFARENKNTPRVNFPGLTDYPISSEGENTYFVCLHNAGTDRIIDDVTLDTTITDKRGYTIYEHAYEGKVTGVMVGLEDAFSTAFDYSNFTINTELSRNGQIIDRNTLTYDCSEIDQSTCPDRFHIPSLVVMMGALIALGRVITRRQS